MSVAYQWGQESASIEASWPMGAEGLGVRRAAGSDMGEGLTL